MRPDFHILIVGGGMAGACVAALAATNRELFDLRLAVLEAQPPEAAPEGEVDLRVSALSRASERILHHVGAWEQIPLSVRGPYDDMRVWDAAGKPYGGGAVHFSASETGEPNLGHIVENRWVQWSLYATRPFHSRVTLLRGQLSTLGFEGDCVTVGLADGRTLSAALVIGSDGANSVSRSLAKLETTGWDYNQHAFVTHVKTACAHQRTAWQRFLPDGPIAFLPLADGRSSIVWTTRPEHARRLLECPAEQVGAELERAIDGALGAVEVAGPRGAFPLRLSHARSYCRERFVLVGDAAHSVHPLAGQGVNLGLLDAAALIEVLQDAVVQGGVDALGDVRVLRRYERWRKSENTVALGLIDGLNRLFGGGHDVLTRVRRAGLALVDRSGIAKRFLMGRALGVEGESPRIVRREGVRS